ncbi:MAG TPA: ABC transporter permease [Bryobacteraceae bacterium]|jgi:ABC-type lipoprotein release transport system permease subunit|nr:ABC transporter permease [Bryobacteraceae bacterium]
MRAFIRRTLLRSPWLARPTWTGGVFQDLRYAWRMLKRSPGVTAVAVVSLALGIGANTAIFTLIESTLLRPIAVKDLDRLRLLQWREQDGGWTAPNLGYLSAAFGSIYEQGVTPDGGIIHTDFSPRVYSEFVRSNTVFESLFTFKELGRVTAVTEGSAEAVNCFAVSGDFYRGVEVSPAAGRVIGPENDTPTGDSHVAVISYDYWTRRFGRSPAAIGSTIKLNENPLTIIGVNPEYFTGIEPGGHFEVWTPLGLSSEIIGRAFFDQPRAWQIPMMGRLKPGVTDARAQSELNALFQAQVDADPGGLSAMLKKPEKRPRFQLQSAARGVDYLAQRYDRMFGALLALAGLVLLIACANVANLLLAKSALRQREISLRLALGAKRARVGRQLLTEGLLLSSIAGVAGVILGYWARNGIPALLATPWRPNPFDTTFDPKALLVSAGITFVTGVLFSLAPVWQSRRVEVNEALKDGSRGSAGLSKLRTGRVLVAFQVALSIVLLAGAGLCVRTFTNLRGMPLGFRPDGLLLFTLDPPRTLYPEDRLAALLRALQDKLAAIPGIQSVTFSRNDGERVVGSRFFETMGIPIVEGSALDEHGSVKQAVVNEAFVRKTFRNEDPIGKTIGSGVENYQIVGVCADWHFERLRDPIPPALYSAFGGIATPDASAVHRPSSPVKFELRMAPDRAGLAEAVMRAIRQAVRSADASLAVTDVRTGAQQIEDGLAQERLMAALALVFGVLALILAMIGIYGVMAYAVTRRTNEIGIRVALGAEPGRAAWLVLREMMAVGVAGIVLGVPAALALGPIVDHLLAPGWGHRFAYGTKPDDPQTIAIAVLALIAAGVVAGYLPARRAAHVDPMTALRHD